MTDAWEPANQLEQQLRDALRDGDQDTYFALVSKAELFVPLPPGEPDAAPGEIPASFTWPTSTRDGRTHVLAYTSGEAARACLGPTYQQFVHLTMSDMARTWPDQEWWLALNSGLPIEGYLPAWFIGQLTAGIAPIPGEAPQHDSVPPVPVQAAPGQVPPGQAGLGQAGPAHAAPAHAAPEPVAAQQEFAPPPDAAPPAPPQEQFAPPADVVPAAPQEQFAPPPDAAPPAPPQEQFAPPPDVAPPAPPQEQFAPPADVAPPAPPQEQFPPPPDSPPPPADERVHAPVDRSEETMRDVIPPVPVHDRPPEPAPAAETLLEPVQLPVHQPPAPVREEAGPGVHEAPPLDGPFEVDEAPVTLHITPDAEFTPLDEEERALLEAARGGDRKEFLRTLLSVRQIWVPVVEGGDLMLAPGRPGFQWYVDDSSGRPVVPLYTGPGRMRDAMGGHPFVLSDLAKVLRFWPDPSLELVVNGGTAIGASIPGDRVTPMSAQVDADAAARLARDFPAQSDAERQMFDVRGEPETIVKVLMDTTVFLPVWSRTPPAVQTRPADPTFPWSAVPVRGHASVLAFTSFDWMKAAVGTTGFVMPTFAELVAAWPDPDWSVSVNPGTPIEIALSGEQIRALAGSLAGRVAEDIPPPIADPSVLPEPSAEPVQTDAPAAEARPEEPGETPPGQWAIMQKVVPHEQVAWYLEQAYDRVGGFVHRVQDVVDLNTPKLLYDALGLTREGSPFQPDDAEVHVIRWPAYRSGLYRLPFGGTSEEALRSWGDSGWVLEPPPFAGDGFAPGSAGTIREYKIDSARLPHGSEMYVLGRDATERFVARYDADRQAWGDSE